MAKSDTVKARFKDAIANQPDYLAPLRRLGIRISRTSESFDPLAFFSVRPESPLAAAFAAAKLDSSDPYAWKQLLNFFAHAHFARKPSNKKWTGARYSRLLSDYNQTSAGKPSWANDTMILETMIKNLIIITGQKPQLFEENFLTRENLD
jgi:hypothetical protein